MELEVINQVFPQEGRVKSSPAARKVVDALGTTVGYLMAQMQTKAYIQFRDGIGFQIRNSTLRANYCRITVTSEHTYTLWIARLDVGERSLRLKTLCKVRNVGSETLRELFEEELFPLQTSSIQVCTSEPVLVKQA